MDSPIVLARYLIIVAPLINTSPSPQIANHNKQSAQVTHSAEHGSSVKSKPQQPSYHLKTLYLFLRSDLKTVVLPWTLFALAHVIASPVFGASDTSSASASAIIARLPTTVVWIVLNLLPFTIGNQRSSSAIHEDSLNKPWRPIPSKRVTPEAARKLMFASYALAYFISLQTGGTVQCLVLVAGGYAYNDLQGGDKSWITRGLLSAIAYVAFGSGATEVLSGSDGMTYSPMMVQWFALLIVVIFCGIPAADIYDQKGDAMVGRDTLPLALGDLLTRCAIAISIFVWSFVCTWFWSVGVLGYVVPVLGGLFVSWRTLVKRNVVQEDRKTYKYWNLWLVSIYCLPLVSLVGA